LLSIGGVTEPFPFDALPSKIEALETHLIDDQFVVYEPQADVVHYLNPSAALIFELCDGQHRVSEILELVRDAYSLPGAPVEDIMACLASLKSAGIVN